MTVRIPLTQNKFLTLIFVYTPTPTSGDDIQALFYSLLNCTIQTVPSYDKFVMLEDFNGRVGNDHCLWNGIFGHHSIEKWPVPPEPLYWAQACCHQLPISSPCLTKMTQKHSQSKHWFILDTVLTRPRDRRDVHVIHSMSGADDCWMDHCFLISCFDTKILCSPKSRQTSLADASTVSNSGTYRHPKTSRNLLWDTWWIS